MKYLTFVWISFLIGLFIADREKVAKINSNDKLSSSSSIAVEALAVEINTLRNEVVKLRKELNFLQTDLQTNQHNNNSPMNLEQPKNTSILFNSIKFPQPKRILVTGGAGFVGSHLVDQLLHQGHEVTVVDNFMTGRRQNLRHVRDHPNLELLHHDVENPLYFEVDEIYHLASPASPPHYMRDPVKTIKTNAIGTLNVLGLARRLKARVLIASTSEVYGDPLQHPQSESYWGNVNSYGPRSCYDEGKRVAESLAYAYTVNHGLEVRIARIFNTYGPRMFFKDGRVVSNFITQAIQNQPLTVYGSGSQTRSFQYISDLVDGLILLMRSNISEPVNLGNPDEYQVKDFAQLVLKVTESDSKILHLPAVVDDPQVRRPDISKAKRLLHWVPRVPLEHGLTKTIE